MPGEDRGTVIAKNFLEEYTADTGSQSSDAGDAKGAVGVSNGDSSTDSVTSTLDKHKLDKLYRKIDFRIIPALWCLYFLSSYGGAAYGNSLTMNKEVGHSLPQYLHLSPQHTSTASALDYVGYIIFDLPMNLIMSKVSPHAWMSRIIVTIGLVYACFTAAKNGSGIIALRFFTGVVSAGIWPGMAYYISLWYPDSRSVTRIGYYFTAAQLSAAAAGLLAAAFQKMDGLHGYVGFQWMFLIYGVVTISVGLSLLWWLPDRPTSLQAADKANDEVSVAGTTKMTPGALERIKLAFHMGRSPLNEEEQELHARDMHHDVAERDWTWRELLNVMLDPRIWPLIMMYFGVVGTGFGIEVYATTIIETINPKFSSVDLSLLTAPIWLFDLGSILLITPFADVFKNHRALLFSLSTVIIMVGLFVCTYASGWSRWGGLLLCGFGLGPTVPITMAWGSAIFRERHGDLGAAASTALISGLGNLGSVTTTYALYTGWAADVKRNFRDSNMVMVAILGISILAAISCTLLRYFLGDFGSQSLVDVTFLKFIWPRRKQSINQST